jgi:hypothetical protein
MSYLTRIFSQIRDNLPLGVGVNPKKFGVNRSHFSFLQKSLNYCKIFTTKLVRFFLQIGDDRPLGKGVIPIVFEKNLF